MEVFLWALCVLTFMAGVAPQDTEKPYRTLVTKRGRFFVYRLHSVDFFGNAPPVTWSASVKGRPELPSWLNLAQSPYSQIAFLYGTPLLSDSTSDILVIAKHSGSFEIAKKTFRIRLRTDSRFSVPMAEIAELWIRNIDAWEILAQTELAEELQRNVRRAFRAKGVRPYVRDLKPATAVGDRLPLTTNKVGVVAYVGTRQGFSDGVLNLERGLARNKEQCHRNSIIPLDKHFRPSFLIDWCRFLVVNLNATSEGDGEETILTEREGMSSFEIVEEGGGASEHPFSRAEFVAYSDSGLSRDYFLDWVMVVVIPAAVLLLVLLILCIVFFGGREGQHWRDHKTSDEQLKEYMSLRRSQQKLRELSTQRQSLLEEEEPEESLSYSPLRNGSAVRNSKTLSPSPSRGPTPAPGPVGKQTVIEAATAKGSRLDLYQELIKRTQDNQMNPSEPEDTGSEANTVVNAEEEKDDSVPPRVTITDTSL